MKEMIKDTFSWVEDGVRYVEVCKQQNNKDGSVHMLYDTAHHPDGIYDNGGL